MLQELLLKYKMAGLRLNRSERVYCRAKIAFIRLDGMKKSIDATFITHAEGKNTAEKERNALVSEEYIKWHKEYIEAQVRMEVARMHRDNADTQYKYYMMAISGIKKELQTLGGSDGY